jgi:hypothetical protein
VAAVQVKSPGLVPDPIVTTAGLTDPAANGGFTITDAGEEVTLIPLLVVTTS